MGMVVSFTRVTDVEMGKVVADPGVLWDLVEERGEEPDGYIDKAWGGLEYLFERARVGVDLFFDGDLLEGEAAVYTWTPELVRSTAEVLRGTPFEVLAAHFDAEDMDDSEVYPTVWVRDGDELGLDYLRGNYENLVEFFEFAAKQGSGAVMSFG